MDLFEPPEACSRAAAKIAGTAGITGIAGLYSPEIR
jgi:hypothetical protein